MQIKRTMFRVAAATTVTAFVSVGAVGPVYAGGEKAAGKSANAQGQSHKAAPASKAQGPKAPGSQARGPKAEPGSKAQGPKQAPASKAQGPKAQPASKAQGPKSPKPANPHANGNASDKSANGNGHTPVTVCHRTGKAGYIVITFDENALEAHLAHGDLYPVPEGGCASTTPEGGGTTPGGTDGETPRTPGTPGTGVEGPVADIETETAVPTEDEVLGVESTVAAATAASSAAPIAAPVAAPIAAPVAAAPASGILPDTGAGDYGWAALAGLGLLAAGGSLLARRRAQHLG